MKKLMLGVFLLGSLNSSANTTADELVKVAISQGRLEGVMQSSMVLIPCLLGIMGEMGDRLSKKKSYKISTFLFVAGALAEYVNHLCIIGKLGTKNTVTLPRSAFVLSMAVGWILSKKINEDNKE